MAVTPADVAGTLGRPAPEAESPLFIQWSLWIGDVYRKVKNRLGDLAALDQDNLDYVVRETVAARAGRPRESSTTVSVDDASVTKRYDGATDGHTLDDSWWGWDELIPSVDQAAFSTRPGHVPDRRPWWPR